MLHRRSLVLLVLLAPCALALPLASCASDDGEGTKPVALPQPGPGEECFDPDPAVVRIRFAADYVALAPGQSRAVEVVVDPDFCTPGKVSFSVSDSSVITLPKADSVHYTKPKIVVVLTGVAAGTTTLTASIPKGDGTDATASIPIDVMASDLPPCSGSGSGSVDDGTSISGTQALASASIGLQAGATKPSSGSFLWSVAPFDAEIACSSDQVPDGFSALGPAVEFSPADLRLPREIPMSVPINTARMPDKARLRHVALSYTGPRAKTPRAVPVADPRILRDADGAYRLSFMAAWLGTYQAIVRTDGGTVTRKRRITHRAVMGISMGGGGAAMHGLRNHARFDAIGALGGPVDWTWLIGQIERNHMGGFLPNDGTTPSGLAPMPTPELAYEHPSTFNRWWYEYPKNGNGGGFPRAEYVQIFRDLALMFGNPNGYNQTKGSENLPAGVPADDKSIVGDHPGRECAVWLDPIDKHPDAEKQRSLAEQCPAERCKYTLTLADYYDDEFNPNGTFPVISVCDGSAQDETLSPYANTWKPTGNDAPLELALAVDYNGSGVRDENEPIIRQGHEPYDDFGKDGVTSTAEPGYAARTNEDPAEDDWHPQYNPTGTENNHRWDEGEPFRDDGLDGVPNTKTSPYDFGEDDGKFTMAPGLRTFLERDSRTVIEQHPWGTEPAPLDDAALARLDLWTDGGTRDLFNFAVSAQALAGTWAGRGRITHYYTGFHQMPGQIPEDPKQFVAGSIDWSNVPGGILLRYGKIDPTDQDVASGTGQHVGTADDITRRLQAALYFVGARWPDAPRALDQASNQDPDPDAPLCEVGGSCDFEFTDSRGRTGPVSVNLPPGYANAKLKHRRYPVVYLLHGYGQTPEDLKAAIVFLRNWMNGASDSHASRLAKAILVYVDGRCRPGEVESECIRGTFFTDSVREHGPKIESWFNELDDALAQRFRLMQPAEIDWVE